MNETRSDSFDVLHVTLKVLFIGLFIAAAYRIMRPFLIPLVWAALIVTATWPYLLKLQGRLGDRRGLAVTVMTLTMLLVVFIPVTLAVLAVVDNADDVVSGVRSLSSAFPPVAPEWVGRIPVAGDKLAAWWKDFAALGPEERSAMAAPYVRKALQWFISKVGGIGMILVQFLLTAIITAILYANGEVVGSGCLSFSRRLAGQRGEDASILAAHAVRGVALGVVLTALIQTAVGAAGLLAAGVPATAILTAVMFMLSGAVFGAQFGSIATAYVRGPAIRFILSYSLALAGLGALFPLLDTLTESTLPILAALAVTLTLGQMIFLCTYVLSLLTFALLARRGRWVPIWALPLLVRPPAPRQVAKGAAS